MAIYMLVRLRALWLLSSQGWIMQQFQSGAIGQEDSWKAAGKITEGLTS